MQILMRAEVENEPRLDYHAKLPGSGQVTIFLPSSQTQMICGGRGWGMGTTSFPKRKGVGTSICTVASPPAACPHYKNTLLPAVRALHLSFS